MSGQQSIAERLKDVRVEARADLDISRHVFMEEPAYILRDPVSFQSHRFSIEDYRILSALRGDRTLAEVFQTLVEQGELTAEDQELFFEFVVSMQKLGLLTAPFTDGASLYKRHMGKVKAKQKSLPMQIMSFKISVFNPDRFLTRAMPYAKFLFTRAFFLVWCVLVATCIGIVWTRRDAFSDSLSGLLAASNIPILWSTLVVLKALHEFGHGFACKNYGGHVPDMGAMFMMGTPCAYVDASSSWSFSRRWPRVVVGLGGMYFESLAAIIATFVWASTGPGVVNSIMHQVIVLASVVTIGFNINPLMRYDGYYILGDLLGLPNLRQMAIKRVQGLAKHYLLGLPKPNPEMNWSLKAILTVFGSLASLYKISITIGLCTVIALKLYWVGLIMGGVMMATTIFGIVSKACKYLWFAKEIAHVRPRAIAYSVVLLASGPLVLLFAPVPGQVEAYGLVATEHEQIVRLETGATVADLLVAPGDEVTPGTPLVQLENDELRDSLRIAEAELAKVQMELKAIGKTDPVEATKLTCQIEYLKTQVLDAREKLSELEVFAQQEGRIVQSVPTHVRAAYIPAGEPIVTVGAGRWLVKAIVNASDLADSRPTEGQMVQCKFQAQAGKTIYGRLVKVSPSGTNLVEMPALTQLGGGTIAVDPSTMMAQEPFFELVIEIDEAQATEFLAHGMVANVRFQRGYESVGWFLYRQVLRFKNNLMVG